PMTIQWNNYTLRGGLPPVYDVPLETGTPIGGVVVDPQGNPVAGARVNVYPQDQTDEKASPDIGRQNVVTDAQGHWQLDQAPAKLGRVYIEVQHPSFPGARSSTESTDASLHQLAARTTLEAGGKSIAGTVLDPSGKPVSGATVVIARDRYDSDKRTIKTDGS